LATRPGINFAHFEQADLEKLRQEKNLLTDIESLALVTTQVHGWITVIIYQHIENDGSTTYLAILNILLRLYRTVDQHLNGLPTIRALDSEFLESVCNHSRGLIRIILPLSVEK